MFFGSLGFVFGIRWT